MTFIIGKFVGLLMSAGTLLLLCCVAGLWLTRHRRRGGPGRTLLWVGVGGFVIVLLLPVDQWALLPLEDRFPQVPHPPDHVDGIIVLGGAVLPDLAAARGIPALDDAAERMTTAVALARRYPTARLVFTGGRGELVPGETTEAEVAGALFTSLGVDPDRLTMESASRSTYENAVMTKAMVQPEPGQTWILVTSALHMPRSVGVFRAAGWPVLPWPVGYKSGHILRLWLPSNLGSHLVLLDEAMHEWIGLVAYRVLGHTDSLLPGPKVRATPAVSR
jgi:uncharacterized SAM-binding protein YcdF (DUF218 family)